LTRNWAWGGEERELIESRISAVLLRIFTNFWMEIERDITYNI